MKLLSGILLFLLTTANLFAITYNFQFRDDSGDRIGTGFLEFPEDPGTGDFLLADEDYRLEFNFNIPRDPSFTTANVVFSERAIVEINPLGDGTRSLSFTGAALELDSGNFYLMLVPDPRQIFTLFEFITDPTGTVVSVLQAWGSFSAIASVSEEVPEVTSSIGLLALSSVILLGMSRRVPRRS